MTAVGALLRSLLGPPERAGARLRRLDLPRLLDNAFQLGRVADQDRAAHVEAVLQRAFVAQGLNVDPFRLRVLSDWVLEIVDKESTP